MAKAYNNVGRTDMVDLGDGPMPEINPNADLAYVPQVDDEVVIPCDEVWQVYRNGKQNARSVELQGVVQHVPMNSNWAKVLVKEGPGEYNTHTFGWAEISLSHRPTSAPLN